MRITTVGNNHHRRERQAVAVFGDKRDRSIHDARKRHGPHNQRRDQNETKYPDDIDSYIVGFALLLFPFNTAERKSGDKQANDPPPFPRSPG